MTDALTRAQNTALVHDQGWKPAAVTPLEQDWKLSPHSEGVDYDDCPNPDCGTTGVEPYYIPGGERGRGHLPEIFHHACGATWSRTPPEAAHKGETARSRSRLTTSAQVGRIFSAPSDAYRAGFDRIDWSK